MLKISEEGFCRFIFYSLLIGLVTWTAIIVMPGQAKASHVEINQEELVCLAKNIYFEARGENVRGQYAVGLVTQNRVSSDRFPDTICEVVKQAKYWNNYPIKNKCHFSWFCDGKSDNPRNKRAWEDSIFIARNLLLYTIEDFTLGSTHYHTKDVSPKWSKEMTVATVIGSHIFYE